MNASKHALPGAVTVSLSYEAEVLVLTVENSGTAVPSTSPPGYGTARNEREGSGNGRRSVSRIPRGRGDFVWTRNFRLCQCRAVLCVGNRCDCSGGRWRTIRRSFGKRLHCSSVLKTTWRWSPRLRTGEQAFQAALEHRPDVVLMDIRMPGTSGVEATAMIADHPDLSRRTRVDPDDIRGG